MMIPEKIDAMLKLSHNDEKHDAITLLLIVPIINVNY